MSLCTLTSDGDALTHSTRGAERLQRERKKCAGAVQIAVRVSGIATQMYSRNLAVGTGAVLFVESPKSESLFSGEVYLAHLSDCTTQDAEGRTQTTVLPLEDYCIAL